MTNHDDPEGRGKWGALRQEIIEAYERLTLESYFEILGVAENATEADIKQAYFQKARKFHPDQYRDPGFADLTDRIEALFMRVGGAYEVLRDPQSRQSYEALLRRRRGSEAPDSQQLALEDVRRLPDEAAVRAALGDLHRPLGLSSNPDFERELSPIEAYILSRVDGKLSAAEVLQLVPSSVDEGERSLLGLLLTGVVELLAPSRPADNLVDSAENAVMAEGAVHRAERLIAETKTWDAIQLLEDVIPRIFGRKQRDRARLLLAKAYMENPKWLRRGEELLQTLIHDDPQNAEAYSILGMLYKESGMSSRAEVMFKKALELRPDHKPASVVAEEGKERRLAVRQLAALTGDTMGALEALESELTAEEREHIRAAVERAKRACHEGGLDELNACLEKMEGAARQLKQAGQTVIGQLAADTLRSFQHLETRLSANERQHVLIALDRVAKLRYEGLSAGFVETVGGLREILSWLRQLRFSH